MSVKIISFTDNGEITARRIAEIADGEAVRCSQDVPLRAWVQENFQKDQTLVFVGAVGIAVRVIAPFIQSKITDPAVLVVDECAKYVIPILSGHIGGANRWAKELAEKLSAQAIITTATDLQGVFAVDVWAKANGCSIEHPENIKKISARLLQKKNVCCYSDIDIEGSIPQGIEIGGKADADFCMSVYKVSPSVLGIVPKNLTLGIGCKKNTTCEEIEAQVQRVLDKYQISEKAIEEVCSIDVKKDEIGLLEYCEKHGYPIRFYSAQALNEVEGDFSASTFVQKTVGVDNVCERSAVLGAKGPLIVKKEAENGVTIALAQKPFQPHWSI